MPQPAGMFQSDVVQMPPSLPIETWRHIMRFATNWPDGFGVASTLPIQKTLEGLAAVGNFTNPPRHIKESIASTAMVCKVWRTIGIQYLLEPLVFTRSSRRESNFLCGPVPASPQGSISPLRYVRRLCGALNKRHTESSSSSIVEPFFVLFSLTTRPVSRGIMTSNSPPEFLEAILVKCGSSLRRLDIFCLNLPVNYSKFLTGLAPGPIHLGIYSSSLIHHLRTTYWTYHCSNPFCP